MIGLNTEDFTDYYFITIAWMLIISNTQLHLIKYRCACWYEHLSSWHQVLLIWYLTQCVWSMYRLLDTLPLYLYYELLSLWIENQLKELFLPAMPIDLLPCNFYIAIIFTKWFILACLYYSYLWSVMVIDI